ENARESGHIRPSNAIGRRQYRGGVADGDESAVAIGYAEQGSRRTGKSDVPGATVRRSLNTPARSDSDEDPVPVGNRGQVSGSPGLGRDPRRAVSRRQGVRPADRNKSSVAERDSRQRRSRRPAPIEPGGAIRRSNNSTRLL